MTSKVVLVKSKCLEGLYINDVLVKEAAVIAASDLFEAISTGDVVCLESEVIYITKSSICEQGYPNIFEETEILNG